MQDARPIDYVIIWSFVFAVVISLGYIFGNGCYQILVNAGI